MDTFTNPCPNLMAGFSNLGQQKRPLRCLAIHLCNSNIISNNPTCDSLINLPMQIGALNRQPWKMILSFYVHGNRKSDIENITCTLI